MLKRKSSPARLPLKLDDAKRHLGVTSHDRDRDIDSLIAAARDLFESRVGLTLISTEWRLTLSDFTRPIRLPRPPLLSIQSVRYIDTAGSITPLIDYQLVTGEHSQACLYPAAGTEWPQVQDDRHDAVCIDYTAGYGKKPEDLPAAAVHWCRLMVRHWYDNPSAVITGTISKQIEQSAGALARSLGTGFYADLPT